MSYTTLNPLVRISSPMAVALYGNKVPPPSPGIASIGSYYGIWQYVSPDHIGEVCSQYYFTQGLAQGLAISDRIYVVKLPEQTVNVVIVTEVTATGATAKLYTATSSVPTIPSSMNNFVQKKAIIVDDMTAAAANWSVNAGSMTRADSTAFVKTDLNCSNALKCDMAGNFCRIQRTIPGTVFTGTLDVWVYIPADPDSTSYIDIAVSKDAFATTNIEWVYNSALFLRAGWNRLSLNVSDTDPNKYQTGAGAPVITGATTFADTMNTIRIIFGNWQVNSPSTGAPLSVYVGGIYYGGESKPQVIFNWDDAWSTQWDIFNIFRSRGLTGSLSVIPQAVNGSGLTLTQLKTMYDWGWDVVNHTMQSTTGNLLLKTDAELRATIGGTRDWMLANGFTRTANILVWPENQYSDRLIRIAQEFGITICRGSRNMNTRTFQGIDNVCRLGSSDFGGKTLAQAKVLLDAAQLYTGTIIIYGHRMTGTATVPAAGGAAPADTLDWYQSDYLAFVDDVAARITAGTITNINYSQLQANCRLQGQ